MEFSGFRFLALLLTLLFFFVPCLSFPGEIPVSRFNAEGFTDYRTLFGSDPPEAEAIAIMSDSDNTGGTAEAWYGEILLATGRR